MKRYRIYKASIHTYRVLDLQTGNLIDGTYRFLTIDNPRFRVNHRKYQEAAKGGFKNSGDPLDYFAWIETDSFTVGASFMPSRQVKFNPFKADKFMAVDSGDEVREADVCVITGNNLFVT